MRARVLGAAAGGGFPQWNCECVCCQTARRDPGRARPRTQCSIAVQGASGAWLLINASPDITPQLEALGNGSPPKVRAVVLTDAELDHTLGLLRIREGDAPTTVIATPFVRHVLTDTLPVDRILGHWAGLRWETIAPGGAGVTVDGLELSAFTTGGSPPRFADHAATPDAVIGVSVSDGERTLVCAPSLAVLDDAVAERLVAADCVLLDGTCWSDDEVVGVRARGRSARAMGHLPLAGPDGSIRALQELGLQRVVLVHVNNTNPVLIEDSPERRQLAEAGIAVADDGLELAL